MSWLARRALFFEITPITQIQIRCRAIFNWKNIEYVKSDTNNIIALNLTNSLSLMLSGANDQLYEPLNEPKAVFGKNSAYITQYATLGKKMAWYFTLLSYVIVNEQSNQQALKAGIIDILVQVIDEEDTTYDLSPLYRAAVLCLRTALANEQARVAFMTQKRSIVKIMNAIGYGAGRVTSALYSIEHEQAIEQSLGCLVHLLESEKTYDYTVQNHPDMPSKALQPIVSANVIEKATDGSQILTETTVLISLWI